MRHLGLAIAVTGLLALVAACGGGSGSSGGGEERVLHLGGGDYTEAEFRTLARAAYVEASGTERFCRSLDGLPASEIVPLMLELQDATPVQEAAPADRERAAEILQEECGRLF